ncbi:MAG TPA: hypothetical protein VJR02_21445 [Pyrinomonadaceae bacterium]|nr:hypothetical protein [Pyrinomonadaceae bacterium]
MGKWAEVECVCPNRVRLPKSDSQFDRPYVHNRRRLSEKEKAEVEEWKRTTENMFACGHRSGLVVELSPSGIIQLGRLLAKIFTGNEFDVFAKVGNSHCYEDELLLVQPQEAELWLLEIDELRRAFEGAGNLSYEALERLVLALYRDDLSDRLSLEARLNEVEAKMPLSSVSSLKQNVQKFKRPDIESTNEKIIEVLEAAEKLCRASIETSSPIRMML